MDNPTAREQIADFERFGQEIPQGLIAPKLQDVELDYWAAFWELSTDRHIGTVSGPIPWSAIKRFTDGMHSTEATVFHEVIRAMDGAYLTHESGESKTFTRDMLRG